MSDAGSAHSEDDQGPPIPPERTMYVTRCLANTNGTPCYTPVITRRAPPRRGQFCVRDSHYGGGAAGVTPLEMSRRRMRAGFRGQPGHFGADPWRRYFARACHNAYCRQPMFTRDRLPPGSYYCIQCVGLMGPRDQGGVERRFLQVGGNDLCNVM